MTLTATQKLILTMVQGEDAPLGLRRDAQSRIHTGEVTDADEGMVAYHATREVAPGDLDAVDLLDLTQTLLGVESPVSFASVVMVSVKSMATASGDYLHVGADPANPGAAYSMRLHPGAWMGICNRPTGWPVTEENRLLVVANMGQHAIPYDIVVIGRRSEP